MDVDEGALAEAVAENQFSGVVSLASGDEPPRGTGLRLRPPGLRGAESR
ncbi:MAG TPA: hypothetical protein PLO15_00795 [Propionicimonas sp.]|nr:hypothetical protein [Propionicimonas sp.]